MPTLAKNITGKLTIKMPTIINRFTIVSIILTPVLLVAILFVVVVARMVRFHLVVCQLSYTLAIVSALWVIVRLTWTAVVRISGSSVKSIAVCLVVCFTVYGILGYCV